MTRELARTRRIVVGVDGSPSSTSALRWAVDQARSVGADVEAVIAWEYPPTYGWAAPQVGGEYAAWAGKTLADSVQEAAGSDLPVEITEKVVCGNPARVLLDAARGADLLVVGNRGHGGFSEALLGSVGQHCVHHAPCPVVIVRQRQD